MLYCGFTFSLVLNTKPSNVLHSSDSIVSKKKKSQKTNTQTAGSDSTAVAPALFVQGDVMRTYPS